MRILFLIFVLISSTLSAQDTVKQLYFNRNKEVKNPDKASHVTSYIQDNKSFLVQYKRLSDQKIIRQASYLDKDMDVFHGTHFEVTESSGDTVYLEYYNSDHPVGIWKYWSTNGFKELDYNFYYISYFRKSNNPQSEPSEIILPPPPPPPPPHTSEKTVFRVVEEMPEFPGGIAKLYEYLGDNIVYPRIARENDLEGKVYLQFVINEDGSVSNVEVIRGVHPVLDKEAARVVTNMQKWKAAKQRGKPVKVYFNLPVTFKLN